MSESEHTTRHPHCITCGGYHEGDFCDTPPVPVMNPAIRGSHIQATGHHDAGAIARCSYCGRYSDNPKALQYDSRHESPKDLRCDCGKTHGWCGSFKRPTSKSKWSTDIIALLSTLTNEERLSIFQNFCLHCGCTDPSCPCWNDE